jgi:histidine ammonia-lyase
VIPSRGDHGGTVSTTLAHVARAMSLPAEGDALPAFLYGGPFCTAALAALAVVRASRVYSAFDEACLLMEGVEHWHGVSSGRAWEILHATSEALEHARETTELSMSPGGAFREPQVSGAMDALRIALTQAATASERRIFRMTTGCLSGLPSFLVPTSGVQSGLMLAQYTAASLVSEMRTASQPVSVDTIPAFGHDEDWTPRGPAAARAALAAVDLAADVAAIELLCAAQACDIGRATLQDDARAVRDQVRAYVRYRDTDRVLHPDIAALGAAVREGVFRRSGGWAPEAPRTARP